MDRTLIPNGDQPESPQARPIFRRLCRGGHVNLVYVSGRHKQLMQEAIQAHQLPQPAFAIGNVGTEVYRVTDGQWHAHGDWLDRLKQDWERDALEALAQKLARQYAWRMQEAEKQSPYKLSYYIDPDTIEPVDQLRSLIEAQKLACNVIYSVDETLHIGLLDLLPVAADKLQAIRFLSAQQGIDEHMTLFAGDSGNDLSVLTSGIKSILVANATDDVRLRAQRQSRENGYTNRLYCAAGGYLRMNGNYSAGVLEGLAFHVPALDDSIKRVAE